MNLTNLVRVLGTLPLKCHADGFIDVAMKLKTLVFLLRKIQPSAEERETFYKVVPEFVASVKKYFPEWMRMNTMHLVECHAIPYRLTLMYPAAIVLFCTKVYT
jgi:hypothetical protein